MLILFDCSGVFLCPRCKTSGQWNALYMEFYAKTLTRKGKSVNNINITKEKEKISAYVDEIAEKTTQLKSLTSDVLINVFTKFKLPVRF